MALALPRRRMMVAMMVLAGLGVLWAIDSLAVARDGQHSLREQGLEKWTAWAEQAHGSLSNALRDDCKGWNLEHPPNLDPPECLRAKQYREIQRFWKDKRYDYDDGVLDSIRELEKCTLGTKRCPTEPLVIASWWFAHSGWRGAGVAGEEVWMREVGAAVEAEGYIFLTGFKTARMLHLTRMLKSSIHMVWMNENNSVECASSPRCIRKEDYRPAEDVRFRHSLNEIPSDQLGAIPLWKLFTVTYWGSRPSNAPRPGFIMNEDWGVPNAGGDEVWSFQPLGRRWQITPFPYPGHTWVPVSMERECKATPAATRDDTIVVMGKRLQPYRYGFGLETNYSEVAARMQDAGVTASFVSTLVVDEREGDLPAEVPSAFDNRGGLSRAEYTDLVSRAKAMYGMSAPEISPSPLLALCKGTPVVLPYMRKGVTHPMGWETYSLYFFQHGPLMELDEPYVYKYLIGDTDALVSALSRAVRKPIKPYVPKGYGSKDVRRAVHAVLSGNHKAAYERILQANDGKPPRVPAYILAKCWQRYECAFGQHGDMYIGD